MRQIVSHRGTVEGPTNLDNNIDIDVVDEPGDGGACHKYLLRVFNAEGGIVQTVPLAFQNGPLLVAGNNGISVESLLAVVIDRLEGFQSGAFACTTNQIALDSVRTGLRALLFRREDRAARGALGTHKV